jgi:hypothetical protein
MGTPQWIKKLGGHAGELFVCAELSKRGIPNALLPENFSDDDILIGDKEGTRIGFIQVKSCHPDRSSTFILRETDESWRDAKPGHFCVLVWLGRVGSIGAPHHDPPRYWIASKCEVGDECIAHSAHGTPNWERRFGLEKLPKEWENRWDLFDQYRPQSE